ncbi:MAG: hypothetical protein ABJA37_15770 [Ferruginibacter sp.]
MKIKNFSILCIAGFFSALSLHAQTAADGIISGYFDAIGGHDKIGQINSVYIEGTMNVMGNSSVNKVTVLNGKGYKSEMEFNGQPIVQTITDKGGWMINPFMGSPDAVALPAEQYAAAKDEIFVAGPLYDYMNNGHLVKFAGMENAGNNPAYKVELTSPDSVKTTFYIDSATHFIDEKIIETSGQSTTIMYSNYKKTDFGTLMAYTQDITIPQGMQLHYEVTKVEINKPVDVSVFDMPKK